LGHAFNGETFIFVIKLSKIIEKFGFRFIREYIGFQI